MKKIIILVLFAIIILGTTLYFNIVSTPKVEFKYAPIYDGVELTYKFIANSKHFGIETGEAYYNDEDVWYHQRAIIIKNFKLLKEIKNLKTYSLDIRFYDIPIYSPETHYQGKEDIKEFLENIEISYDGNSPDPFLQSKEYEFKDNLKISINYCLNNDKCYEEKLKLNFLY